MSRNKHHMLYYYSRWCGSPEGTAINRMNRRMSLERGRHSLGEGGVHERCRQLLPRCRTSRRSPKAESWLGGVRVRWCLRPNLPRLCV